MTRERPSGRPGPARRDLSESERPGWNRHMSLQEAAGSVQRLARYEPGVVAELPSEGVVQVEVNGILAGAVRCLPDAPAELALGWALMHGFFRPGDPIDSVTVDNDRVSLMIGTLADVEFRRLVAVGWRELDDDDPVPDAAAEPFAIHADILLDLAREAIRVMAKDRSRDGFVHAAAASDTAIHCVGRDLSVNHAVAKVAGWMVRDGAGTETAILVVRGMVDRVIVATAAVLGISIIVTTGIPTANAFREAIGREISIVGMATSQRPGLLVDAGHVVEEDDGA